MPELSDDQMEDFMVFQDATIEASEKLEAANSSEECERGYVFAGDDHVNLKGVWYVKDFPKLRRLLDCIENEQEFLRTTPHA